MNNWLNANKICLNVSKIEVVPFKSLKRQADSDLQHKLTGKRLYPTDSVKFLGINIDKNLAWCYQINNAAAIKYYVTQNKAFVKTLKSYYAICKSR